MVDKEKHAEQFSDSDAVKNSKETAAKKRKNPIKCGGKEVRSLIPATQKKRKLDDSSEESSEEAVNKRSTQNQIDLNELISFGKKKLTNNLYTKLYI